MVEQERRKYPRHELRIEAKLATEAQTVPVAMTNVSEEGVLLESAAAIPEGTQVVLSFQMAEKTFLKGEVVWLLDTFVDDIMVYLIGMEIEAIVLPEIQAIGTSDKTQMIREIISWIETHPDQ